MESSKSFILACNFSFDHIFMKELIILKNRSDIGAGTRGSDMGIDALEIAAINVNNDFFNRHPFVDVETHNETVYNKVKSTTAKRINFVLEQCKRLKKATQASLEADQFPLVLSGDHSSALGTLAGIKAANPKKTLGVLWIDAHADLHSPMSSPSGNIHGMPLAAALGQDNFEYQTNPVSQEILDDWKGMKDLGSVHPILKPEHLIYFGVRDIEAEEEAIIKAKGIRNYPVYEVRHRGLKSCINETLDQLRTVDHIYITFDADALDCDLISRGTGTPVSKGFDPQEIVQLIQAVLESNKVVALEISEINPLLDEKGNRMAEVVFDIIQQIFKT